MNKEILNNLKIGEKAVDIQEYYHGENGKNLVYKVIIYECTRKYLIFKRIKTYVFPFYFKTKEFAEQYIQDYNKFEIVNYNVSSRYKKDTDVYTLFPKEFETPKHLYCMVDSQRFFSTSEIRSVMLKRDGIWDGIVNDGPITEYNELYKSRDMKYTEIFEKEKLASKEGTTGKTFSYKLSEV